VKPLYIVGTDRNVGKTTFCIGLIHALRRRKLSVGYTKPLGQRVSNVSGRPIHDDALVISEVMGLDTESSAMAVPLTRGRVEKEIYDLHLPDLTERIAAIGRRLSADYDVVLAEGMGHVAMGSCLNLSAADVARILGAKALLISGGGIGRAIDAVSLCATFMTARGTELTGVVVNKVWPEKYTRVKEATTRGLANLGVRSFGTVPYERVLAAPTLRQVADQIGGEVLAGAEAMENRVGKIIVAAMEADHMVGYLNDRALVITPGDRNDNILAILSTHVMDKQREPTAGMVLTGGFRPSEKIMDLLAHAGLPAILCKEDTYAVASRLQETVFKITPDDRQRIDAAMRCVNEYVDVDGILDAMDE